MIDEVKEGKGSGEEGNRIKVLGMVWGLKDGMAVNGMRC